MHTLVVEDEKTVASFIKKGLGAAAEDTAVRPFHIDVPDEALVDLRRRIAATRWPDKRSEPHAGRFAR
jgi:hypothetical protein